MRSVQTMSQERTTRGRERELPWATDVARDDGIGGYPRGFYRQDVGAASQSRYRRTLAGHPLAAQSAT